MEDKTKRRVGRPRKEDAEPVDPNAPVKPVRGRPKLGDKALSAKQIKDRYTKRLRDKGGKTVSCVIQNGELTKVLRKYALESKLNFRSETAAASFILEKALRNMARRTQYAEDKESEE
jgi:hypothetical protein